MAAESPVGIRTQAFVVLAAVLLSAFSQMTMQPAAAPLALELGLDPWHVGVAVAASAAMMLAAAPAWMRAMRTRGPRGPLVAALALAALAMAAFSSLAMLGARGMVDGWLLVAGLLVLRGVALGASLAAVGPAARIVLALVADPAERMRRFAAISTVQGIAVVMGVMLGGALSTFGALLPIAATPVLLAIAAAAVALGVAPGVPAAPPMSANPVPLVDRRTWAFGAVTLVLLASVACLQVVLGFVLQHRLELDAATTGFATGAVLCLGGLAAVVAQTRIARAASRAIVPARVGLVLATVGIAWLVVADELLGIVGAVVVGGAGVGLALSGLAGVTSAGPGGRPHAHRLLPQATVLGVVVGPPLGTLLLAVSDEAPFIACASLLLVAIAVAFAHPSFRAAPTPEPLPEPAAA